MDHIVFPGFKDIFPKSNEPTVEELIDRVSSKEILKMLSMINLDIYLNRLDTETNESIFLNICQNINETERSLILHSYIQFRQVKRSYNPKVIIFFEFVILKTMINVLKRYNDKIYDALDSELLSITVLQLLLLENTYLDKKQKSILGNINLKSNFVVQASQCSFNLRDPFYQLNLSSEFLSYLHNESNLKPFLVEFLSKMRLNGYKEYMNLIIELFISPLEKGNYILKLDKFYQTLFGPALDHMSIDVLDNKPFIFLNGFDSDYKIIREKPLLKLDYNIYCVLDLNFLIDKLYIGIIFSIYYSTTLKDRKDIFKNFADFLSHLGQHFAENQLLYRLVPNCFKNDEATIRVAGNVYPVEYSDYYVRQGNNIFLFELKNYIINADIKDSYNYDKIRNAVNEKMLKSTDSNKSKGVSQLINTINKIHNGGFSFDNLSDNIDSRLNIYPILVYTDEFFDITGMQELINQFFRKEIPGHVKNAHYIRGVILINLYDLIRVSYTVHKGQKSFMELMNIYYNIELELHKQSRMNRTLYTTLHFRDVMHDELIDLDERDSMALMVDVLGEDALTWWALFDEPIHGLDFISTFNNIITKIKGLFKR